jgi:transketolase
MRWAIGQCVQTRDAYGEALLALGREREDIVVLDADLQRSNRTYAFGQEHPARFFDMGIAEADLVSTAAGMAATGMTPFANSFAMFVPGRSYDQIRLQVAYGRTNVKLAGASAGLTIGPDGATHQSLDDIALMRQLPNLTVIVPADAVETYQVVFTAAETEGPFYIRLGRYPTPVLFGPDYAFEVGAIPQLRSGADVALLATGIMVAKALAVAEILGEHSVDAAVSNVSTIKPMKPEAVLERVSGKHLVVTMEEHSIIGGLGSAVAEIVAADDAAPPLVRIGIQDRFGESGAPDELLEAYGLTPEAVAEVVLRAMH